MTARPWIKSYPAGMRWDAPLETGPLQGVLEQAARKFADKPALNFMGRRISYRELDALADRAAAGFQKLGVGPGVHVGLFLPNTPHYVIAFFGVLKAGGVVVNYSPLDAETVLQHKIDDSETDIMVTVDLGLLYPQMDRLAGATRLKKLVVGEIAEMTSMPDLVRAQMKAAGMTVAFEPSESRVRFATLLDNDGHYQRHPLGDPEDALCCLQYTGGTTGLSKGAMLSHANLTAACSQFVESATGPDEPVLIEGAERTLAVLPPFHIFALTVNMILGLRLGVELVLHAKFEAAAVIKDIADKKITVMPGVPTMYVAMLHHPGVRHEDLASLKYCSTGGAPMPLAVQKAFQELSGCRLVEGWGMTETSPAGTFTPLRGPVKQGSCGIPLPGIDIKFADVADPTRYVAYGERGEICIKGPNVTKGYWKRPEAMAENLTADGYFRTGDVAWMDEDGYIYIVDRTKDMILCGGFNVYPRNIEEAIYKHPLVEEVTVIGVPDEYRGQSPKAFVKLKAGAAPVSFEEMKDFLKDKLGKHEMIGHLELRAELPKTPVGKLSKKELYAEEEQRRSGG
ncbi:MAG: long-chain fatty acid--CoA ligase [Hyphomicrobiales bacterium]|nr:long-chain fatty acid--CoA ligase [Hyphomicrobiales bacterium]